VTAERAFLRAMGGGCHSPVAALAQPVGELLHLRAMSFVSGVRRGEAKRPLAEAVAWGEAAALGEAVAEALR
jgi:hydroxymethylbilane synthase